MATIPIISKSDKSIPWLVTLSLFEIEETYIKNCKRISKLDNSSISLSNFFSLWIFSGECKLSNQQL